MILHFRLSSRKIAPVVFYLSPETLYFGEIEKTGPEFISGICITTEFLYDQENLFQNFWNLHFLSSGSKTQFQELLEITRSHVLMPYTLISLFGTRTTIR